MNAQSSVSPSEVSSRPEQTPSSTHQENSSLIITNHKLNGHNYLQWSQSVFMYDHGMVRDSNSRETRSSLSNVESRESYDHGMTNQLYDYKSWRKFSVVQNGSRDLGCSMVNLLKHGEHIRISGG